MTRTRVVVCGTNYGRAYLRALARRPEIYELVGVLARGSWRSHQVAAYYGVPLFHAVEALPDDIHMACIAVDMTAWSIVPRLIGRGIHVLCEHPQRPRALRAALRLSGVRGLSFHINSHFLNLPSAKTFIELCRRLQNVESARFVDLMATERTLYGSLDLMRAALGSLRPLRVRLVSRRQPFTTWIATRGTLPIRIAVQTSEGTDGGQFEDGSPDYLLDYRLVIGFSSGLVSLLGLEGPVIWNKNRTGMSDGQTPIATVMSDMTMITANDLKEQRTRAILRAIDTLRKSIRTGQTPATQRPEHILEVSRAWENILIKLS